MRDPFPIAPPEALIKLVQPYADAVGLRSLPLHAHEAIFATLLYTFICSVVSPIGSRLICPKIYNNLNKRTRINWDVHVTSFFQSVLISAFSFYVIFYDEERKELRARDRWEGRVWEYSGLGGLCQSFGLGYFIWDFIMCVWRVDIFGWGMVAHAVSALSVFSFGYRPFIYYYAPVFLLYELSSPFLNIHWFCDKVGATGSTVQAINGAFLTGTFFGCRLIWGNISSVLVFTDIYRALKYGSTGLDPLALNNGPRTYTSSELLAIYADPQGQRLAFAGEEYIPLWLGAIYLASNLTLNSLNIFWFNKMIQTIRSRFEPPLGTKGTNKKDITWEPQEKKNKRNKDKTLAELAAEAVEGELATTAQDLHENEKEGLLNGETATTVRKETSATGSKSVEITGTRSLRTRRA